TRSRHRRLIATSPGAIVAHHLHQHAFAQTTISDTKTRAWVCAPDRLEDRATGKYQMGTLGAYARAGHPLFVAHRKQLFYDTVDLLSSHPATVNAVAIVAFKIKMHASNCRHRTRRSEHVNAVCSVSTVFAHEWRDKRGDLLHHRLVTFTTDSNAAIALGQRHHAVRDRGPTADLRQGWSSAALLRASKPHYLRRAAADIEQNRAISLRIDQRRAASCSEPRFRLAIDDFERKAQFVRDTTEKLHAVLGRATSFCRDQAGAGHALVLHLVAANGQRCYRARNGGVAQAPRRLHAFTQSNAAGKCIYDAKAFSGWTRHQQPAIVGPEIERGIGGAPPVAAEADVRPSRRPPTPPGARQRRPVDSGVEAWDLPGLAAHAVNPSCRSAGHLFGASRL